MKKESPCGFSSASAIIWYCNPVPFHDIYTSFATSFFQVVVTLPLGLLALQCSQFRVSPALERRAIKMCSCGSGSSRRHGLP